VQSRLYAFSWLETYSVKLHCSGVWHSRVKMLHRKEKNENDQRTHQLVCQYRNMVMIIAAVAVGVICIFRSYSKTNIIDTSGELY
jgi:hypothetical protein